MFSPEQHFAYSNGIYRVSSPVDPGYPDNGLWDALNMVYEKDADDPQTMRGNSQHGSTAMAGTVSGLFDFDEGTALVATAEDGKWYIYSGGDWAEEGGAKASNNSTTAGVRWSATMFYGATTGANLLCAGNGVDEPVKHDGNNVTRLGTVATSDYPPATGQYPTAWQGRLWWASGTTLFGSKVDDCEVYSVVSGGVQLNVYRGTGDITGLFAFANNLFVFKRKSIYRIAPTSSFSSESIVRNVSGEVGCVSYHTITEDDKGLNFMSEHAIQRIRDTSASSGFAIENASRNVKSIFDWKNKAHENKAWATFDLNRMEYFFQYPIGSTSVPASGLIGNFSTNRPRWTRTDRQNMTAGVVMSSTSDYQLYVGDTDGKVWKMHDENSFLWKGATMTSKVQTKYYNQNAPYMMKKYGWGYVNAESDGAYDINVTLNLIRVGLTTSPGNRENIGVEGGGGWGVGEWGKALWGGSGYVGARIRCKGAQRGTGLQVTVDSARWFKLRGTAVASKLLSSKTAA